jgi:hypothetical protein
MNPSYCDLQKTYPLFRMKTGGKSLLTNSIGKRLSELQSDLKVFGIITVDLVREPTKISISVAQSFVENLKAEPGVTECMIALGITMLREFWVMSGTLTYAHKHSV